MPAYFTVLASLIIGIIVGVLAWLMLGERRGARSISTAKACNNCGSSVLEGWRLCPDCGGFLDDDLGTVEGSVRVGARASDPESELSF